jgi:hypothetical protein
VKFTNNRMGWVDSFKFWENPDGIAISFHSLRWRSRGMSLSTGLEVNGLLTCLMEAGLSLMCQDAVH